MTGIKGVGVGASVAKPGEDVSATKSAAEVAGVGAPNGTTTISHAEEAKLDGLIGEALNAIHEIEVPKNMSADDVVNYLDAMSAKLADIGATLGREALKAARNKSKADHKERIKKMMENFEKVRKAKEKQKLLKGLSFLAVGLSVLLAAVTAGAAGPLVATCAIVGAAASVTSCVLENTKLLEHASPAVRKAFMIALMVIQMACMLASMAGAVRSAVRGAISAGSKLTQTGAKLGMQAGAAAAETGGSAASASATAITKATKTAMEEAVEAAIKQSMEKVAQAAAKEAAKTISKELATEVSEAVAKDVVKAAVKQSIKQATERISSQVIESLADKAATTITREVGEEIAKEISKQVSKEVAEQVGEEVASGAVKQLVKEVTKEAIEEASKEAVENVGKFAATKAVCIRLQKLVSLMQSGTSVVSGVETADLGRLNAEIGDTRGELIRLQARLLMDQQFTEDMIDLLKDVGDKYMHAEKKIREFSEDMNDAANQTLDSMMGLGGPGANAS